MTDGDQIIDVDAALRFTGGDRQNLSSIAELFAVEGPRQLQVVHACIEAGDTNGTREAAHTLKGSVVIFGAERTAAAAKQMELVATEDWDRVPEVWRVLSHEMEQLLQAVREL